MAVATAKPVNSSESSPAHYDFTDPARARAAWHEWFSPCFALIRSRPEIKWFHHVNCDWTRASNHAAMGWKNNDLTASPSLLGLWTAERSDPRYLHASVKSLLRDFDRHQWSIHGSSG